MNNVCSKVSLLRQEKLKHHDGSEDQCNGCKNECHGVAPESSRQAVPILRTLYSPSDLGGIHIRNRNNQHHILLQRYACKRLRLERDVSGLHNL